MRASDFEETLAFLCEEDAFVCEMANFLADVTELPANIVLWTYTQPNELPHTKYRMKVFKNRVHSATYSIGSGPRLMWQINRLKFQLNSFESREVIRTISEFSSLFIQYVDEILDATSVKQEIKKQKGELK